MIDSQEFNQNPKATENRKMMEEQRKEQSAKERERLHKQSAEERDKLNAKRLELKLER